MATQNKFAKLVDGELIFYIQPNNVIGNIRKDAIEKGFKDYIVSYEIGDILTYEETETEIKEVKTKSFEFLKQEKINELMAYDSSGVINVFYINGIPLWYDKALRTSLRSSVTSFKNKGKTHFNLCLGAMIIPFGIDDLLNKLDELEVYATECLVNTTIHKNSMDVIENEADLIAYDFTLGYDTPLNFIIT